MPILALAWLAAAALQPAPAVRARPVNPLYAYITAEDYPAAALRAEDQGRTEYRLDIDAGGVARQCTILVSSGSAALDGATCRILRSRVRFVPARDRSGRFMADSYASSISWSLADEPAVTFRLRRPLPPVFGTAPTPILPPRTPPLPPPAPAGIVRPPTRAIQLHPYPAYLRRADYPAAARRNREEGQVYFTLNVGPDGRVADCTIAASSGSAALDAATCRILRGRARYAPARDAAGAPVADVIYGTYVWLRPR